MGVTGNGVGTIVRLDDHAEYFGLVCSDVELPGANGWTLLEWVRTLRLRLPTMFVSGVDDKDFPTEVNRCGAVAAFRKPFRVPEIRQIIAEVIPCL